MTAACNQLAISPRLRWSYFQGLQWAQTPVTIHFQSGATCDVHEESTPQKNRPPCLPSLIKEPRPGAVKTSWMNTIRRKQKTSHEWDERKSLERWKKKLAKKTVCCRQTNITFSVQITIFRQLSLIWLLSSLKSVEHTCIDQIGRWLHQLQGVLRAGSGSPSPGMPAPRWKTTCPTLLIKCLVSAFKGQCKLTKSPKRHQTHLWKAENESEIFRNRGLMGPEIWRENISWGKGRLSHYSGF